MVFIDIPEQSNKEVFVGDGTTNTFIITETSPINIEVYVSGLLLTEGEDYSISSNEITLIEPPLADENINIFYKY